MDIDYERLKLKLTGDIHVDHREDFDLDEIVNDAVLDKENMIITVKSSEFWFKYDANTYEQISGGGGIKGDIE